MILNVFVNNILAGTLFERKVEDGNISIVFSYDDDATVEQRLSLDMPLSKKEYTSNRNEKLHPIFDMLLPEGHRRLAMQAATKIVRTDDFGLLALVGTNTVGRITVSELDSPLRPVGFSYNDLVTCENGRKFFDTLLERSGWKQGVSGVQPKVLDLAMDLDSNDRTVVSSTHIIKTFDSDYPHLTINEYACLSVAKKAGIDVPEFSLSKDGSLLAVKRFDIAEDGTQLGLEEALCLMGGHSDKKYEGSYGEVATLVESVMGINEGLSSLHALFKRVVFSVLTRNGDFHLKNLAFIYTDEAELAPAYDLICTHAYMSDPPALALEDENYSKIWWSRGELVDFAERHCYLTKKQANTVIDETGNTVREGEKTISKLIAVFPEFKEVGQAMTSSWLNALHEMDIKRTSNSDTESDFEPN